MYSTLEPCHMCAKAIIDARIKRLIFATEEPKHGSIVSVDNFFDKSYLNHSTTYESGLLKEESALLLKSFLKKEDSLKNFFHSSMRYICWRYIFTNRLVPISYI